MQIVLYHILPSIFLLFNYDELVHKETTLVFRKMFNWNQMSTLRKFIHYSTLCITI